MTGENPLPLTVTAGGVLSADLEAPYAVMGDTGYLQIGIMNLS